MKILIIDNYDSFTYNLYHYVQEINPDVTVIRNDKIVLDEIEKYDFIIISPGPGLPEQAGKCMEVVEKYYRTKKILGVCLGHQAIALVFGGRLKNLNTVLHGLSRPCIPCTPLDKMYLDLPPVFLTGRYHSWVVDKDFFFEELIVTAYDDTSEIMSFKHKKYDVRGMQYHPESIMTEHGKAILKNCIK